MEFKNWADVATIISSIGVLTAVGALFFAWKQLKLSGKNTKHSAENLELSAKNSRAQLWMDLRKMFDGHMEVHSILRPNEKRSIPEPCPKCCNQKKSWPCCKDEWVKVEAYMGLFEHCEGLLEEKLIDENTFRDIYSYRISNIVNNEKIKREKLVELGRYWLRFRALAERFDITLPPAKEG